MHRNYKYKYESSKKASEAIHRFRYYAENVIPDFFPEAHQKRSLKAGLPRVAAGPNNLAYLWACQFVDADTLVDQSSILHSIKATHLEKNSEGEQILKLSDTSYQKKSTVSEGLMGLLTSGWEANEVIEFVLKVGAAETGKIQPYQLYVIHHCQPQVSDNAGKQLKWLHFVEKYYFIGEGFHYESIAVLNNEQSYWGMSSSQKAFTNFLRRYHKIETLQGLLMQYQERIKEKIKLSEDPAFSQQHRLIKNIPGESLKTLYTLKKEFPREDEQTICRFMIGRDFKLEQTRQSLVEYRQFIQRMSKFKWEDFEQFHQMNIFYYLGEDYRGRPVILNKAKNVLVDRIDAQRYCDYYMYYLEVFIAGKMRGNVTQVNIIADVEGIGSENFKLAITKQNINDGKLYCVERQFNFFAVNVASFAYFCYRFIKPLLPKKTQEKIYIGGNDAKEIFENLNKEMSEDVIPTYLGGKNPVV